MEPYRTAFRVYYEDTDAGGVVYHARYLAFAERARTEALRAAGVPHADLVGQHRLVFMVRRIEMRYLAPARLDDLLEVRTSILHVGGALVRLRQDFTVLGAVTGAVAVQAVGELRAELACVRLADGRPARIPDRWRDALGGRGEKAGGGQAEGSAG